MPKDKRKIVAVPGFGGARKGGAPSEPGAKKQHAAPRGRKIGDRKPRAEGADRPAGLAKFVADAKRGTGFGSSRPGPGKKQGGKSRGGDGAAVDPTKALSVRDVVTEVKKEWESARVRDMDHATRRVHLSKIMSLIRGRVHDVCVKHDASRVVQSVLKYGEASEKADIVAELVPHVAELSKRAYARFLVCRVFLHGNRSQRSAMFDAIVPGIRSLAVSKEGSKVVEYVFTFAGSGKGTDAADAADRRRRVMHELYGPMFKLVRAEATSEARDAAAATGSKAKGTVAVKDLAGACAADPKRGEGILRFVMELITRMFDRPFNLAGFTYVHALLADFLAAAPRAMGLELLPSIADHAIDLSHTAAGTTAIVYATSHGSAKDRKKLVKAMRGFVPVVAAHEHGYLALTSLCRTVDDTRLLSQVITTELIAHVAAAAEASDAPIVSIPAAFGGGKKDGAAAAAKGGDNADGGDSDDSDDDDDESGSGSSSSSSSSSSASSSSGSSSAEAAASKEDGEADGGEEDKKKEEKTGTDAVAKPAVSLAEQHALMTAPGARFVLSILCPESKFYLAPEARSRLEPVGPEPVPEDASKKDPEVRRRALLDALVSPLLSALSGHLTACAAMWRSSWGSLVLAEAMADHLKEQEQEKDGKEQDGDNIIAGIARAAVAAVAADDASVEPCPVADRAVKRLVSKSEPFARSVAEALGEERIQRWAAEGSFVAVALAENAATAQMFKSLFPAGSDARGKVKHGAAKGKAGCSIIERVLQGGKAAKRSAKESGGEVGKQASKKRKSGKE